MVTEARHFFGAGVVVWLIPRAFHVTADSQLSIHVTLFFITALLVHECLFWDPSRVKEGPHERGTVKSAFAFPCFLTTDCRVHFRPTSAHCALPESSGNVMKY
jgi:hypothetical protein